MVQGDRFAKAPRWDVNILVTGNQAGFTKHFQHWNQEYMDNFLDDLEEAINSTLSQDKQISQIRHFQPQHCQTRNKQMEHQQLKKLGYPGEAAYKNVKGTLLPRKNAQYLS